MTEQVVPQPPSLVEDTSVLPPEVEAALNHLHDLCDQHGLEFSCVIEDGDAAHMQFTTGDTQQLQRAVTYLVTLWQEMPENERAEA